MDPTSDAAVESTRSNPQLAFDAVQALAQSSLSPTTTFTTPPQVFVSPRFHSQSGQDQAQPIAVPAPRPSLLVTPPKSSKSMH